jgi:predicted small integral membrane protein
MLTDNDLLIVRVSKILLVAAVAFFYTLVVFNNLTDYDSNYQFVRHVLLMDSTFPGNHGMWRAMHPLWIHAVFYDSIILWEGVSMVLTWAGAAQLLSAVRKPATAFQHSKRLAIIGLTVSLLMWFVAFLSIGGGFSCGSPGAGMDRTLRSGCLLSTAWFFFCYWCPRWEPGAAMQSFENSLRWA